MEHIFERRGAFFLAANFLVMFAVAALVYFSASLWWTLPASVVWLGPHFVFCGSPKLQNARLLWNSVAWGLALGTLLRL